MISAYYFLIPVVLLSVLPSFLLFLPVLVNCARERRKLQTMNLWSFQIRPRLKLQSSTRCIRARLAPTKRRYASFFSCKNMSVEEGIPYSSNKALVFSSAFPFISITL